MATNHNSLSTSPSLRDSIRSLLLDAQHAVVQRHFDLSVRCCSGVALPFHGLILGSVSPWVSGQLLQSSATTDLEIPFEAPDTALRNIRSYAYTGSVEMIADSYVPKGWDDSKPSFLRNILVNKAISDLEHTVALASFLIMHDLVSEIRTLISNKLAVVEPISPAILSLQCNLSDDLNQHSDSNGLTILELGEYQIACHRWLLAARSPYFEAMLSDRWSCESSTCTVRIDIQPTDSHFTDPGEALNALKLFLYTDGTERLAALDIQSKIAMLDVADFINFDSLKRNVESALSRFELLACIHKKIFVFSRMNACVAV
jgi:hypothetical protein